jgi:hypothetical protein
VAAPAEAAVTDTPKTESTAHPPKRPRKPRREETAPEEAPAATVAAVTTEAPAMESSPATTHVAEPSPQSEIQPPKSEEPTPIPAAAIPEVAPVAPHSAEPFVEKTAEAVPPAPVPANPAADAPVAEAPAVEPAKAARKRIPKKPTTELTDSSLSLDITETPVAQSAEVHEQSRTSDGATRLIVTAYIGIGNRLFIRGEGPGLSWEKGVPLQFVSIGKWRWETNDAATPVKFKLYKNDDLECTALGAQTLDPGQQQEVTAAF